MFATLISDFRQHGKGKERNAMRLKTYQRNLEVQKGMENWRWKGGGPRSDQSDRVTVQNTLHYAPTGGRDQIVNNRTCPTNLGVHLNGKGSKGSKGTSKAHQNEHELHQGTWNSCKAHPPDILSPSARVAIF